jgi:hypothetical protein
MAATVLVVEDELKLRELVRAYPRRRDGVADSSQPPRHATQDQ